MEIREKLLKDLDSQYHKRVEEICSVLNPNLEYKYIKTKNMEVLKTVLKEFRFRDDLVSGSMDVLHGKLSMYPVINVEGNFVCVLLETTEKKFDDIETNHTIVVFEYDTRLLKGIFQEELC